MLGKNIRKLMTDIRGATAVETAFVFPLFVMFIFGVVELGQGLKLHNELASAASRASRMVMINAGVTNTALETKIRDLLHGLSADNLNVSFSNETLSGTVYRVVNITYPHEFTTPFLGHFDFRLSATSRTPEGT